MICFYFAQRMKKRFNPWQTRGIFLWVLTSLEVATFTFWMCLWVSARIEQFTGRCFPSPRTFTCTFQLQATILLAVLCPCKLEELWDVSEGTRAQRKLANTSKFSKADSRTEVIAWTGSNVCAQSFLYEPSLKPHEKVAVFFWKCLTTKTSISSGLRASCSGICLCSSMWFLAVLYGPAGPYVKVCLGWILKVQGVDEVGPQFLSLHAVSLVLHVVVSHMFAPFAAVWWHKEFPEEPFRGESSKSARKERHRAGLIFL